MRLPKARLKRINFANQSLTKFMGQEIVKKNEKQFEMEGDLYVPGGFEYFSIFSCIIYLFHHLLFHLLFMLLTPHPHFSFFFLPFLEMKLF